MTDRDLLNLAKSMLRNAYVPYTGSAVGAAIECEDGTVFTGCTIENTAIGGTLCAERVAAVKAVSEGNRRFLRLALMSGRDSYPIPCGTCRQMLAEFAPDMEILCAKASGAYVSYKLRDLLPLAASN